MTPADDEPRTAEPGQHYRHLPPGTPPGETVAGVDPDPVPDPDAARNLDQHRALRDD